MLSISSADYLDFVRIDQFVTNRLQEIKSIILQLEKQLCT